MTYPAYPKPLVEIEVLPAIERVRRFCHSKVPSQRPGRR